MTLLKKKNLNMADNFPGLIKKPTTPTTRTTKEKCSRSVDL